MGNALPVTDLGDGYNVLSFDSGFTHTCSLLQNATTGMSLEDELPPL